MAKKNAQFDVNNNLAIAIELHKQGRIDEAAVIYKTILDKEPRHSDACYLLSLIYSAQGQPADAIKLLEVALSSRKDPTIYWHLGSNLATLRRYHEAEAAFLEATKIRPNFPEALCDFGLTLLSLGKIAEATTAFRKAIALQHDFPLAHYNLAIALRTRKEADEAIASLYTALSLSPEFAEAYTNLSSLLLGLDETEKAVTAARHAITISPNLAEACSNYAESLWSHGSYEKGIMACRWAIMSAPGFAKSCSNLGFMLRKREFLDESVTACSRAVCIQPDFISAHCNLADALLTSGNLVDGLKEYEWRWLLEDTLKRNFPWPQWSGEPIKDKVLLLHAEQGFGDTIHFIRYMPELLRRAGTVIVELPRPLKALVNHLLGDVRVVFYGDELPSGVDLHCPLLSLPQIFETGIDTVPADVPYLHAEPERVAAWRERLPKDGFKIGIAWQGKPGIKIDKGRSLPVSFFEAIARIPNVRLISLQKNYGLDQLASLPQDIHIETLGDDFDSGADAFLDTAAVMANLDLIITSDTSIPHLAGALGCPVWVAIQATPEWRWMIQREDSPWYPTMRLFRQNTAGDWASVFSRIADSLGKLLAGDESQWRPDPTRAPIHPRPASLPRPFRSPVTQPQIAQPQIAQPQIAHRAGMAPANPGPATPLPLLFQWGVSLRFSWGIFGFNLLQHWPQVAGAPALCGGGIDLDSLGGLDPLTLRALTTPLIESDRQRREHQATGSRTFNGVVLESLGNRLSTTLGPNTTVPGRATCAAVSFEDTILPNAQAISNTYGAIIAGSTWAADILRANGVSNVVTVFRGIDPSLFHPAPRANTLAGRFVVFSGGKLEYRKGHDLVLLAFRAFSQRHPEALLVTAWHSPWPSLATTLNTSRTVMPVTFAPTGHADISRWVQSNGIAADNHIDIAALSNHFMGRVLREMDVAVFPNRCEGATNFVAMECLASGVPVIVSDNTGHKDLVATGAPYALTRQQPIAATNMGTEGWGESDVEEIVEALERVWSDRNEAQRRAAAGVTAMSGWHWHTQAQALYKALAPFSHS
jgi:tetratricopeptide (TPR) repeat protein/glycosyltransferase involved in cell wall biosynthesis